MQKVDSCTTVLKKLFQDSSRPVFHAIPQGTFAGMVFHIDGRVFVFQKKGDGRD